jgi:hypothetical protein
MMLVVEPGGQSVQPAASTSVFFLSPALGALYDPTGHGWQETQPSLPPMQGWGAAGRTQTTRVF